MSSSSAPAPVRGVPLGRFQSADAAKEAADLVAQASGRKGAKVGTVRTERELDGARRPRSTPLQDKMKRLQVPEGALERAQNLANKVAGYVVETSARRLIDAARGYSLAQQRGTEGYQINFNGLLDPVIDGPPGVSYMLRKGRGAIATAVAHLVTDGKLGIVAGATLGELLLAAIDEDVERMAHGTDTLRAFIEKNKLLDGRDLPEDPFFDVPASVVAGAPDRGSSGSGSDDDDEDADPDGEGADPDGDGDGRSAWGTHRFLRNVMSAVAKRWDDIAATEQLLYNLFLQYGPWKHAPYVCPKGHWMNIEMWAKRAAEARVEHPGSQSAADALGASLRLDSEFGVEKPCDLCYSNACLGQRTHYTCSSACGFNVCKACYDATASFGTTISPTNAKLRPVQAQWAGSNHNAAVHWYTWMVTWVFTPEGRLECQRVGIDVEDLLKRMHKVEEMAKTVNEPLGRRADFLKQFRGCAAAAEENMNEAMAELEKHEQRLALGLKHEAEILARGAAVDLLRGDDVLSEAPRPRARVAAPARPVGDRGAPRGALSRGRTVGRPRPRLRQRLRRRRHAAGPGVRDGGAFVVRPVALPRHLRRQYVRAAHRTCDVLAPGNKARKPCRGSRGRARLAPVVLVFDLPAVVDARFCPRRDTSHGAGRTVPQGEALHARVGHASRKHTRRAS